MDLAPPGEDDRRRTKSSVRGIVPVRSRQTVLIVEDNIEVAETLFELLNERGHQAIVSPDAAHALEQVARESVTVAILDLGLPDLDGYQLAGAMRDRLGAAAVPRLIALTGFSGDDERQRSQRAGFAAHLVKPVDLDALFHAVETASSLA